MRFADIDEDTTLDLDDLERQLSDRTRVVAFPVASNAVGTLTDVRRDRRARARGRRARLGRRRPLRAARADRRRRARRRRPRSARRTSTSARTSGSPTAGASCSSRGARTRCARAPTSRSASRFETGTLPYELLAGFVAAVEYIESLGWDAIVAWERELGARFLAGLPDERSGCTACRRWRGACRRSPSRSTGIAADGGGAAARRARLRRLARQLLRARGDEAARPRGRRRRRPRRASSTTTPPRRSTGSSRSSPGWSDAAAGMGRARRARAASRPGSGPGRPCPCRCRGSRRTRWSTGCSAAALWLHGSLDDPRRADAVLLAADAGVRRLAARRVRAAHRLRRAAGAAGARDVARGGAGVLCGRGRSCPPRWALVAAALTRRGAGADVLGAADDARCSSTRCSCSRPGRRPRRSRGRHGGRRRCSWSRSLAVVRDARCRRSCCCRRSLRRPSSTRGSHGRGRACGGWFRRQACSARSWSRGSRTGSRQAAARSAATR